MEPSMLGATSPTWALTVCVSQLRTAMLRLDASAHAHVYRNGIKKETGFAEIVKIRLIEKVFRVKYMLLSCFAPNCNWLHCVAMHSHCHKLQLGKLMRYGVNAHNSGQTTS